MPIFSLSFSIFLVSYLGQFVHPSVSQPVNNVQLTDSEVESGILSEADNSLRLADQQFQDESNAFRSNQVVSQVAPGVIGNPNDNRRFWANSSSLLPNYPLNPGLGPVSNSIYAVARSDPQGYYYNNSVYEFPGLISGDKVQSHQYLDPSYAYVNPNAKYVKPQPIGYDQNGNLVVAAQAYKIQSPINYQAPLGGASGVMNPQNSYPFGNASGRGFNSEHGFYNPNEVYGETQKEASVKRPLRAAQLKVGSAGRLRGVPRSAELVSRPRREMPTNKRRDERTPGRRDLLKQILGSVPEDFNVQEVGPISLGGKLLKREADTNSVQNEVGDVEPQLQKTGSGLALNQVELVEPADGGDSSYETGSKIRRQAHFASGSGDMRASAAQGEELVGRQAEAFKTGMENGKPIGFMRVRPKYRREAVSKTGDHEEIAGVGPDGKGSEDSREKLVHRREADPTGSAGKASDRLREKLAHWRETDIRAGLGSKESDGSREKLVERQAADFHIGASSESKNESGEKLMQRREAGQPGLKGKKSISFRGKLVQRREADFRNGVGYQESDSTREKLKHWLEDFKSYENRKVTHGVDDAERGVVAIGAPNRLRRASTASKCLCTSKVAVNAVVPCSSSPGKPVTPKPTPAPKHTTSPAMCTTKCVLNILVPCKPRHLIGEEEPDKSSSSGGQAISVAEDEDERDKQASDKEKQGSEDALKQEEGTEERQSPDLAENNPKQQDDPTGNEVGSAEKQSAGLVGVVAVQESQSAVET